MEKLLPVLIILLLLAASYYFLRNYSLSGGSQNLDLPIDLPQGGVCDSKTVTCSDGTVSHKQGTDCTFPPCPSRIAGSSANQ